MDYRITLDNAILMNYPKYTTLNEANKIFVNSKFSECDRLNLYIDATQIISSLYTPNVMIVNNYGIISGLINLCAHLRDYYRRAFSCETRIFIVYSTCMCSYNIALYPEYFKSFYISKASNSKTDLYILDNIKMLGKLAPYINGVYFVPTNADPIVKIADLIMKEQMMMTDMRVPHIIFSKDPYMFMIPSRVDDTFVFKLHKSRNEYITVCSKENALLEYMRITRREISSNIMSFLMETDSAILGYMLSFIGVKSRSIKPIKNLSSAVKILSEHVNLRDPMQIYNLNMEQLYDSVPSLYTKINKNSFLNRWKCIDLIYQLSLYSNLVEAQSMSYLVDINDPISVKEINDKYMVNNPLDLNRL